jgi:hypothetical protein
MLIGPIIEGDEDENDQSLDFFDQNDEMDIYPALNLPLADVLPASLQSTPMPDIEMYEATELVNDDDEGSDEKILDEGVSEEGSLAFMAEWLRPFAEQAKADEGPIEKPAATINAKDYVYVRTLTIVAQEDISKIEAINLSSGKGRFRFIGDEHVMTYWSFLCNAKIIQSDTQIVMNLSRSEKRKIYSRDESLFLPMDSGEEIAVETRPFERPPEKPAAAVNEEDYIYVQTLTPVAPEDISKIEQVGKGTVKFIGNEHVMTYANFLRCATIIQSDTQVVMDLSYAERKKIYSRDGSLFLPMDLGEEIEVETCPFERPPEKPVATINKEDYVYVRTLTPVVPEDLSKIEAINLSAGKGRFRFIGDEHVVTYGSFLSKAKIIRSDTQAVMALSFSKKKKIYSRDGCLFLMDSGKEIQVETCPFERPTEKPAAAINDKDYVYVRTLMPVSPEDLSKIEEIGRVKFINDEHVMTYKSFLSMGKIIRSDTQTVMDLSYVERKKIYSRDGSLFLPMDLGEEIEIEICPITRPDKKRKQEDITKHNEPEDSVPSAKRKKAGEVAETAIVSRNKNRFFRKKLNINDDKNRNTENGDDYDMGEAQNGPR